MVKVIVVGGGWAGVGAALGAVKGGADEVVVIERTDMLLGTGLVGGIFRNNGRFTAAEEAIAMGAGEAFEIMDKVALHRDVEFPGHKHASLYSIYKIEPYIKNLLSRFGIKIVLESRVTDVRRDGNRVTSVVTESGEEIVGDAFVDTTGTSANPSNCIRYGKGCAYCILRCYSYKPRVSITEKLGVIEYFRVKVDGSPGVFSGSVDIALDSLSKEIKHQLQMRGVVVVPLPKELVDHHKLELKACIQYAHKEFAENLVLLHTGAAKLMTPFFPLNILRKVPGFEEARYEDPLAGGRGNSVRFLGMSMRGDDLRLEGVENVFVAGEKSGPIVGHTEAYITGVLAGYNAAVKARGKSTVVIPGLLAVGDFISYVNTYVRDRLKEGEKGIKTGFTFSGGDYFDRMKRLGYYTTDTQLIRDRVRRAGLENFFGKAPQ